MKNFTKQIKNRTYKIRTGDIVGSSVRLKNNLWLTAGHCVTDKTTLNDKKVRLLKAGVKYHENICEHYDRKTMEKDVALFVVRPTSGHSEFNRVRRLKIKKTPVTKKQKLYYYSVKRETLETITYFSDTKHLYYGVGNVEGGDSGSGVFTKGGKLFGIIVACGPKDQESEKPLVVVRKMAII